VKPVADAHDRSDDATGNVRAPAKPAATAIARFGSPTNVAVIAYASSTVNQLLILYFRHPPRRDEVLVVDTGRGERRYALGQCMHLDRDRLVVAPCLKILPSIAARAADVQS